MGDNLYEHFAGTARNPRSASAGFRYQTLLCILLLLVSGWAGVRAHAEGGEVAAANDSPIAHDTSLEEVAPPGNADTEPAEPATTEQSAMSAMPINRSDSEWPTGANIAVIRVKGEIYDFVLRSMRRRFKRATDEGAGMLVLELETPGGRLDTALKITAMLKSQPVPVIAWINQSAYSAGTIMASACDAIVMNPASTLGDAAPISMLASLSPTERAKALSPLLEDFRDAARRNTYPFVVYHAMCELGVEVYLVEHVETGQRKLVNQADFKFMVQDQDKSDDAAATVIRAQLGPLSPQQQQQPPAQPSAPPVWRTGEVGREVTTEKDRGMWRPVERLPSGAETPGGRVHDGRTLLTMNQTRCADVALSVSSDIASLDDLKAFLNAASVARVKHTWSEVLAGFMTSPGVRSVLILALLLGGYMELQSPGVGLPGAVAVLALAALIISPYVIGLAETWHVIAILLGMVLIAVEVLVLPGFGIFGVLGIVFLLTGVIFSAVPAAGDGLLRLPPPELWGDVVWSAAWTLVTLLVACVCIFYISKHMNRLPLLNCLVLQSTGSSSDASAATVAGSDVPGHDIVMPGAIGVVVSELHPAGRAQFDQHMVDVISQGQFIRPGITVRVIEVRGNRIVVETAEKGSG
jgi:membrane-bound serine protease (ClpP class)